MGRSDAATDERSHEIHFVVVFVAVSAAFAVVVITAAAAAAGAAAVWLRTAAGVACGRLTETLKRRCGAVAAAMASQPSRVYCERQTALLLSLCAPSLCA